MNEQVRNDCCENNCNNWSSWNNTCGCQNSCCNNCGTWNAGSGSWNWIWWIIIFVVFLLLISGFSGNGCF